MKVTTTLSSAIALLVVALCPQAMASPHQDVNQQPLDANPNPTAFYDSLAAAATELATSTSTTSSSVLCDFPPRPTGCALGELFPFPFNCTKFYLCTSFGPLMQNCPNGTVFDFGKEKCLLTNETACTGCCMKTDCDKK